ncbi:MAG: hypothetical protein RI826_08825 [Chlorobium phaeovibrioides]|nr:hypothetical protein [Chlorobium phaeovibrioides]
MGVAEYGVRDYDVNDGYLRAVLVLVRGTDWEASVNRAHAALSFNNGVRGWYTGFMLDGAFDNAWSVSLDAYLRKSVEWELMPLSVILTEIQDLQEEQRKVFIKLMDRYGSATMQSYRDGVSLDRYEYFSALTEFSGDDLSWPRDSAMFIWFLGDATHPEMFDPIGNHSRERRMYAIQELKKRLAVSPIAAHNADEHDVVKTLEDTQRVVIDVRNRLEPLGDVLRAVKNHQKGVSWPAHVIADIRGRFFLEAGSTARAIELFCEIYQCREWFSALSSSIKREQIKKKSSI